MRIVSAIDTTRVLGQLTDIERYAVNWLTIHGFEGELKEREEGRTIFSVNKDGQTEKLILPKDAQESYMDLFGKEFDMLQLYRMSSLM